MPPSAQNEDRAVAETSGFSLHAGVGIEGQQRERLERPCRYVSRRAVATERLPLTGSGLIRCALKNPYRDGTTHLLFEPLDFLARLAALVPPPRLHLTRYHGVFAAHSRWRAQITPAGRGGSGRNADPREQPLFKHVALTWMQRLKRVFAIDIERCGRCGAP